MDMYHWNKQFQALSGYETIPTSKGAPLLTRLGRRYGRVSFSSEGEQRVVSASAEISDWILSREKLNLNKMGNAFEYNPPILYQSG